MMRHDTAGELHVRKVHLRGNNRTSAHFFDIELQSAYQATTLESVAYELEKAKAKLNSHALFDSIDIHMDAVSNSNNETDVRITVKEKNWYNVYIGADTNGYEGAATTRCTLVNPLGEGERAHVEVKAGHQGSASVSAKVEKPYLWGLPYKCEMNVSQETLAYERFSSYSENFRGGDLTIRNGCHTLSAKLGWRDIVPRRNIHAPTAFAASKNIIAEASPSTKTSLFYKYEKDGRDNPVAPLSGQYWCGTTEVAGLFGDVSFIKQESIFQKHIAFGPEVLPGLPLFSLGFCHRLGGVKSFGRDADRSPRINDRFFLGGPTTLRGFDFKGVGPRSSPDDGGNLAGDVLGGEVYTSSSLSLSFPFPIPALTFAGVRGQIFTNFGNLTSWNRVMEKTCIKNLYEDIRTSVGVGLVWGTSLGRVEANYSWILNAHSDDQITNGQVGISMNFS